MAVLFAGFLYSSEDIFAAASLELESVFGKTFLESQPLPWNYTDYYESELDSPVFRRFNFFGPEVDAYSVVDAKVAAMTVEERYLREGRRQINIDPGYMTLAKVVLASRKNYSHRIYLGRGVFAEVELYHGGGSFNPLPYTYPDYRDERFLDIFAEARELLKKRISRSI